MAAPMKSDGWFLLVMISLIMAGMVYFQLDVSRILRLIVMFMILLGVLSFFIHIFKMKLQPMMKPNYKIESKYSTEELESKKSNFWQKKQEENDKKAADFEEQITKPRQEAHLKKTEEQFQTFSGPTWKGKGFTLGGDEQVNFRGRGKKTSKDALSVRHLPDSAYPPAPSPNATQDKPKIKENKMVKLPEEPLVGSDLESITVGLRMPFGDIKRRRFLTSVTIQVILDWLTIEGYNTKIYTISTSYPRKDLSDSHNKTLKELGLVNDVILMVDEKGI